MHTRCPHCDTCFRVTPEHLELAKGAVRCGRCFNTFNARNYLVRSDKNQTDENERIIAPPPDKPDNEQPRADTGTTPPQPSCRRIANRYLRPTHPDSHSRSRKRELR